MKHALTWRESCVGVGEVEAICFLDVTELLADDTGENWTQLTVICFRLRHASREQIHVVEPVTLNVWRIYSLFLAFYVQVTAYIWFSFV